MDLFPAERGGDAGQRLTSGADEFSEADDHTPLTQQRVGAPVPAVQGRGYQTASSYRSPNMYSSIDDIARIYGSNKRLVVLATIGALFVMFLVTSYVYSLRNITAVGTLPPVYNNLRKGGLFTDDLLDRPTPGNSFPKGKHTSSRTHTPLPHTSLPPPTPSLIQTSHDRIPPPPPPSSHTPITPSPLPHASSTTSSSSQPSAVVSTDLLAVATKILHPVDHEQLAEELVRGKARLCAWWAHYQHHIVTHIHQILGDFLNLFLNINFEYSNDRKMFVLQLEKYRQWAAQPPRVRGVADCSKMCGKGLVYFIQKGVARAHSAGASHTANRHAGDKEDTHVSSNSASGSSSYSSQQLRDALQQGFRQSMLECMVCRESRIEVNMECDVQDSTDYSAGGVFAQNHQQGGGRHADGKDMMGRGHSVGHGGGDRVVMHERTIVSDIPVSKLLKHTFKTLFRKNDANPFFFQDFISQTFENYFALFDTYVYNPEFLDRIFPLPSKKTEIVPAEGGRFSQYIGRYNSKLGGTMYQELVNYSESKNIYEMKKKTPHFDLETMNSGGGGGGMGMQLLCEYEDEAPVLLFSSGGGGGRGFELNVETCMDNDDVSQQSRIDDDHISLKSSAPFQRPQKPSLVRVTDGEGEGRISLIHRNSDNVSDNNNINTNHHNTFNKRGKLTRTVDGIDTQRRVHMNMGGGGGLQVSSAAEHGYDDDVSDWKEYEARKVVTDGYTHNDMFIGGGGGGSLDIVNNHYKESHGSQKDDDYHIPNSLNKHKKGLLRAMRNCLNGQLHSSQPSSHTSHSTSPTPSSASNASHKGPRGKLMLVGGGGMGAGLEGRLLQHITYKRADERKGKKQEENHTLSHITMSANAGFSFKLHVNPDWLDNFPTKSLFSKKTSSTPPIPAERVSYTDHRASDQYDPNVRSPDLSVLKFSRLDSPFDDAFALKHVMSTCTQSCLADVYEIRSTLRTDSSIPHTSLVTHVDEGGYDHYHYDKYLFSAPQRDHYLQMLQDKTKHGFGGKFTHIKGITSTGIRNTHDLFYAQCMCPCFQRHLGTRQWTSYLGCTDLAIGTLDRTSSGHVDSDASSIDYQAKEVKGDDDYDMERQAPRFTNEIYDERNRIQDAERDSNFRNHR